jgi:hypothetical protein
MWVQFINPRSIDQHWILTKILFNGINEFIQDPMKALDK